MTTKPSHPQKDPTLITVPNLSGLSATIANNITPQQSLCIIVNNNTQVDILASEITGLIPTARDRVRTIPDLETLPYDMTQPHPALVSDRMESLYHLQQTKAPIIITSLPSWCYKLPSPQYILDNCLLLKVGDELRVEPFREMMQRKNYQYVREVQDLCEFTIKGSIIDLFPTGSKTAFRIELFDNEIDSIRLLDSETQRSKKTIAQIRILPAQQYDYQQCDTGWIDEQIENLLPNQASGLLEKIRKGQHFAGMDYFLPLVHKNMSTLQEHLPCNTRCLIHKDSAKQLRQFQELVQDRYHLGKSKNQPLLAPESIFQFNISTHNSLHYLITATPEYHTSLQPLPPNEETLPAERLKTFLKQYTDTPWKAHIVSHNPERTNNLQKFIQEHQLTHQGSPIEVENSAVRDGFVDTERQQVWISEADILGRNIYWEEKKPKHQTENIDDWTLGVYLVHRDYGIGKLTAFETLQHNKTPQDYLVLTYQDEDKLYVNTQKIHLLSLYRGKEISQVNLDKLGGKKWQQKKKQANIMAEAFAEKLLSHHTKRKTTQATACIAPNEDYLNFTESFPFETTKDQQTAIDDVLHDLQKKHGMDRLICGDVGFGKTEVALRAAFLCIMSGMQVAMLCPTTLLAEQHSRTCRERFNNWPINVENLSRLTKGSQNDIMAKIKNGHADCVIATHALLSPKIQFKKLGLIIIDEEHKFGVKQKEMLQMLRGHTHILSMSATPIPRTLNLALAKIRDLSIIASPPKNRLKVNMEIGLYDENIIKEAVERERLRGGQLYYMHNDIKALPNIEEKIQRLCPNVKTTIISGQSNKNHLEKTMLAFSNQQFDVLIATSIIESGIDIPNANTIIIHRADLLGLSQIHQLKGRVGRSQHQAYAYLFIPPENCLTKEGRARIASIKKQNKLGAGFNIAMEDLEIRGAGDILGKKQSGHIAEIGMALYTQMLRKALADPEKEEGDLEVEIESTINVSIPKEYISSIGKKLELCRKINSAKSTTQIDDIKKEIEDCYGMIPKSVYNALQEQKVRIKIGKLGIKKVTIKKHSVILQTHSSNNLDVNKLLERGGTLWETRIQGPCQISLFKKSIKEIISYEEIVNILYN